MKRKPTAKSVIAAKPAPLKEAAVAYTVEELDSQPMIRTQIYLTRAEHEFLQDEASRRGAPMAAVIRAFIDEKMEIPEDAWINNPMLEPTQVDPDWKGHEDSGINHDHYLYGSPKKWIKVKGEWVEAPPLPDDYYENRVSAKAYDRRVRQLDESR